MKKVSRRLCPKAMPAFGNMLSENIPPSNKFTKTAAKKWNWGGGY